MTMVALDDKAWTRSIRELIQNHEYEEAYGLTRYFPGTVENQFLQCASLAGMEEYGEADRLLKEMQLDITDVANEWADALAGDGAFLIELSVNASTQNYVRLGQLCFEGALVTQSVSEDGLALALCHLGLAGLRRDHEETGRHFRLLGLEKFERHLRGAARSIYERYQSYERRNTLWMLLKHRESIPPKVLASLLDVLFEYDLGLDEDDLEHVRPRFLVPSELKGVIEQGLGKQTIRPRRERWIGARGDMAMEASADLAIGRTRVRGEPSRWRIERHTRIEFPAQCVVKEPVTLSIQLTKDVPALTRVLKKILVKVRPDVKTIRFDIHVTAPAFALQEHKRTMSMAVDSDSEKVSFVLFPVEWGEQAVEIEIFHESSRVGYMIINTFVGSSDTSREALGLVVMEDPIENLDESILRDGPHRRILWVRWDEQKGEIAYDLKGFKPNDSFECEKPFPQLRKDIEGYLKEINEFLNEVVVQAKPGDDTWESMCLTLRGYGARLFEQLIPAELAEKCREWEPGITIIISTNENWIPWELLFDGQEFWGKKYHLGRYPRFTAGQRMPTKGRTTMRALRSPKTALNVIGGGIPKPDVDQVARLFEKCLTGENVKILQARPVSVFNGSLPTRDLVHCTCHGRTNPHMLQLSDKQSRAENLLLETVGELSLEQGCLVFANACSSNVPVLTFGQFGSFGWEFYRRGAGIFIGTLGEVPTRYAIPFAESVYEELFRQNEIRTVGQAVARAKQIASQNRNLFWLLYMVYGDPDLSLKTTN